MTTLLSRAAGEDARATTRPSPIAHDRHGFVIDGRRRVLLAGTIAYFRLARSDWRDRLTRLRQCGFNTVDVYVPWNYHEPAEGEFDFDGGNRSLDAYLALCGELGLFVYLRPGPYICNEWDGGGLPAWLYVKEGVRLRQNQPAYLEYVRRYLGKVNEIARRHLHTKGGPVVLYALENELDYFPCEDPAGYIGALRDAVRADGIDVPLTACVGNRTPIAKATGRADGVLPTPNIYYGGEIEKEAARTLGVLHGEHYKSGTPMVEVPPFVTEMGRGENDLRRILSAGFKGLGPFNFAGGANFGRWHAVNNWKGLSYLSTTIDFGGMVGFDGRIGHTFEAARRLAGLVNAFEEEIALAEPVTSWEAGAPSCDNAEIGAREDEARPGRVYSLGGRDGAAAFVFLWNGGREPQTTKVTAGGQTFPQYSELTVTRGYDHVALADLPLARRGIPARIAYSTAEVAGLAPAADGQPARLLLCGARGTQGEIRLEGDGLKLTGAAPEGGTAHFDAGAVTLVFAFGDAPTEATVRTGDGARLRLVAMERAAAGWDGVPDAAPGAGPFHDLLAAASGELPAPPVPFHDDPIPGAGLRELERLGLLHGAGWYEVAFDAPAGAAEGKPEIVLGHAGDVVSAWLDGRYLGTFLGDGGPLTLPLSAPLAPGRHTLRLRAEIWGHSNFDDHRWPSARLGSLRGVWGGVTVGGAPLPNASWRFAAEPDAPVPGFSKPDTPAGPVIVAGGEARGVRLPLPRVTTPRGAVLHLEGTDCWGEIRTATQIVGRFAFGPEPAFTLTGGPADRFFLPAEYLEGANGLLDLTLRGAGPPGGDGGRLTRADLEIVAGGRQPAPAGPAHG